MRKRRLIWAVLLFVPLHAVAGSLSPARDWRACPVSISASSGVTSLNPLMQGKDASWQPDLTRSEWMAFQLPEGKTFLLTFTCSPGKTLIYAVLERRQEGMWRQERVLLPKGRLSKFRLDRTQSEWWRVRFTFRAKDEPTQYEVSDIALHGLDMPGRKDYWIVIGASIQAQSVRQKTFQDMVTQRYPGYDPVIFNLAVGGWRSDHLRKALPSFLKDHPDASYVGIHIGGNNVTPNRPYPGGADDLRADLVAILEMIRDSGKIPILSRLSYRAYKNVPPEENGSGPYVTAIYDPLIREYCPDFFVDAYGYFKTHQDELMPDGIHVNPKGQESWDRLWAEEAGRVIYR